MKSLPAEWIEHDKKIRPYIWSHRVLSYGKSLFGLCFTLYVLFTMRFALLEWWLSSQVSHPFLLWLAYFGLLAVVWEVLTFPFSVAHHWIERVHQLSKQGYLSWFWDRVKGYLVGAVIGTIVLGLLYLCVTYFPETWWLWACTGFVLLSIVLAQLAPVLLIPIFFKLHPMEEGELKKKLLELCQKFSIHVSEVYHLGLGEKTEKGNAAFVGLGRTKRIIIGDTLYKKFPMEQVEAVFAHELGHQVHNDLWKGILLSSGILYVSFFVTDWMVQLYVLPYFGADVARPYGMLLFFIVLSVVQTPVGWIQNLFSRWRERMADDFGKSTTGLGAPLADALERLTYQNRGPFKPNVILEWFTYSHPAPWRRITTLRA